MQVIYEGVFARSGGQMEVIDELVLERVEAISVNEGDCGRCGDCSKCADCGKCGDCYGGCG